MAKIKDGVVVLKDGTLRKILMTSSINFALKSEDEQNALIASYVGFLNSLDFPIQIVVQSRRLQIEPYLDNLKTLEQEQKNELLKEEKFQRRKEDLDLRVRHVESGLASMGLQVVMLDTQALIELYYATYNPD